MPFSTRLLTWFDHHGRFDLPWQQNPTPYRVWVSEIMLQQTQVNTVIPYYNRFLRRFPDVQILANASLDEVLHFWSGLGYYSRARCLHKAAQQIHIEYENMLPKNLEKLKQLPGIGLSTAGAILALAYEERYPILDGNVKRVLCRYYAIEGSPADKKVEAELWHLAEQLLPHTRIAAYTQAIMDLGATVCGRSRPLCSQCPLQTDCVGYQQGRAMDLPVPKSRKVLPIKSVVFIMLQNQNGDIFLEKRPAHGIWGGLWSFPECATVIGVEEKCMQYAVKQIQQKHIWPVMRHSFTHFHLDITPIHIFVEVDIKKMVARPDILWYDLNKPQECGMAAPVIRLLAQLNLPKFQLF